MITVKRALTSMYIVVCLLFLSSPALSEQVFVVVHKDNNDVIDENVVKSIYSDNKSHWDSGEPILVYELPVSSHTRETFARHILNKTALLSQRDWSNRFVNNTLRNDVKVKPVRLVGRFISVKKNAIGYVTHSEFNSASNLKLVMIIE